ncbi:hypothetical protein MHYP_G00366360, partial [Metynnis hypsauchen]
MSSDLFVLAVIRKFLTNQEIIKEQMGILVKLVYELKGNTEESPSLPPESLPIATLKDLQVLEGQLQDQEFKKTLSDLCIKPTGATYEEARVKLPEAERFTDLTDSEDSPHKRKRRRLKKNPFVQDDEESDDERQETSSLPSPPRTGTAKMLPHLSPLLSRSLNAGKSGNERTAISESVIRKFLTNQEIIKEQMGILVKLVYELKGNTEESPSLPPESLPIATLKDLQVLEGQLQDQEFKKTL